VHSIELLEDWLPNDKEVILVGHDEECANLSIAIIVPEVVLGLHRQIILIEHELDGLEFVNLCAVDIGVPRIDQVVNIITCSKDDLRDNLVVKITRHQDMR
jgi:hypothetical protein